MNELQSLFRGYFKHALLLIILALSSLIVNGEVYLDDAERVSIATDPAEVLSMVRGNAALFSHIPSITMQALILNEDPSLIQRVGEPSNIWETPGITNEAKVQALFPDTTLNNELWGALTEQQRVKFMEENPEYFTRLNSDALADFYLDMWLSGLSDDERYDLFMSMGREDVIRMIDGLYLRMEDEDLHFIVNRFFNDANEDIIGFITLLGNNDALSYQLRETVIDVSFSSENGYFMSAYLEYLDQGITADPSTFTGIDSNQGSYLQLGFDEQGDVVLFVGDGAEPSLVVKGGHTGHEIHINAVERIENLQTEEVEGYQFSFTVTTASGNSFSGVITEGHLNLNSYDVAMLALQNTIEGIDSLSELPEEVLDMLSEGMSLDSIAFEQFAIEELTSDDISLLLDALLSSASDYEQFLDMLHDVSAFLGEETLIGLTASNANEVLEEFFQLDHIDNLRENDELIDYEIAVLQEFNEDGSYDDVIAALESLRARTEPSFGTTLVEQIDGFESAHDDPFSLFEIFAEDELQYMSEIAMTLIYDIIHADAADDEAMFNLFNRIDTLDADFFALQDTMIMTDSTYEQAVTIDTILDLAYDLAYSLVSVDADQTQTIASLDTSTGLSIHPSSQPIAQYAQTIREQATSLSPQDPLHQSLTSISNRLDFIETTTYAVDDVSDSDLQQMKQQLVSAMQQYSESQLSTPQVLVTVPTTHYTEVEPEIFVPSLDDIGASQDISVPQHVPYIPMAQDPTTDSLPQTTPELLPKLNVPASELTQGQLAGLLAIVEQEQQHRAGNTDIQIVSQDPTISLTSLAQHALLQGNEQEAQLMLHYMSENFVQEVHQAQVGEVLSAPVSQENIQHISEIVTYASQQVEQKGYVVLDGMTPLPPISQTQPPTIGPATIAFNHNFNSGSGIITTLHETSGSISSEFTGDGARYFLDQGDAATFRVYGINGHAAPTDITVISSAPTTFRIDDMGNMQLTTGETGAMDDQNQPSLFIVNNIYVEVSNNGEITYTMPSQTHGGSITATKAIASVYDMPVTQENAERLFQSSGSQQELHILPSIDNQIVHLGDVSVTQGRTDLQYANVQSSSDAKLHIRYYDYTNIPEYILFPENAEGRVFDDYYDYYIRGSAIAYLAEQQSLQTESEELWGAITGSVIAEPSPIYETQVVVTNITLLSPRAEYRYLTQDYHVFSSKYGDFEEKTLCFMGCSPANNNNLVQVHIREDPDGIIADGRMENLIVDYAGNVREVFEPNFINLERYSTDYTSYFHAITVNSIEEADEFELLFRLNREARNDLSLMETLEQHQELYYQNAKPASFSNLQEKVNFYDDISQTRGHTNLNLFSYISEHQRKLVLNRYSYNNIIELYRRKHVHIPVQTFVMIDNSVRYTLNDDLSIKPIVHDNKIIFRSPHDVRYIYGELV